MIRHHSLGESIHLSFVVLGIQVLLSGHLVTSSFPLAPYIRGIVESGMSQIRINLPFTVITNCFISFSSLVFIDHMALGFLQQLINYFGLLNDILKIDVHFIVYLTLDK